MFQWLKKHFTRVVYFPEDAHLGYADEGDWEGVLDSLADGYKKHKDMFNAIQIILHRKLAEIRECPIKGEAERGDWVEEQKGLARDVSMLSYLVRLPLYAQQAKKRREKEKEKPGVAEKVTHSPHDPVDS